MMVAPLIARGAAALAARAAAKNAAKKSAQKSAKPEDKMLDKALVGLSGAKAAGATGMAMREEDRRAEKKERSGEDAAETKRESRGMKAGGFVRAADGCAKKGKTKGKMI
jgi:hypothetical protein